MALRRCILAATIAWCSSTAAAQEADLRDVVTLKDGKEHCGRVVNPFTPGPLVVAQGRKRIRVDRAEVASTDTVSARLAEFFRTRQKLHTKPAAQPMLFDWAKSRGLDRVATLHAMADCLASDDSFGHEALGHQKKGGTWLWPHAAKQLPLEQLENALADEPMTLVGERFSVRVDGNLRAGVHALLDLERMGVHMTAEFGEALALLDAQEPVLVDIRSDLGKFQKWGFRPAAWFEPQPHGDIARTLYPSPMQARPQRLFFVGAHGLLYRALIGETNSRDDRDRVCAWLEVGLSMQMETAMQGDAGWAEPAPVRSLDLWAAQTLGGDLDLSRLSHQPMFGGFYLLDDAETRSRWALATTFVQWLLSDDNVPATRARFLSYVRLSLGDRRGDSSTAWDGAMGKKIDEFREPFRAWLKNAGGK